MKYLIVLLMPLLITVCAFKFSERIIHGKVTDDKGTPITGASVIIKNTKIGTATDTYGNYSLKISNEKAVLVFSSVGYESREIKIGSNDIINVSLKPVITKLDEVVVIGYGVQRKMMMTGSVAVINQGSTAATAPQYLQGKIAGVMISNKKRKNKFSGDTIDNSWRYNNNFNREEYDNIEENKFLKVSDNPLSTFSIDVDAASYSNIRRMINAGQLPPAGAVRIEEMINYFSYQYPQPTNNDPFSVNTEISKCPWNKHHQLVLIGLQGKKVDVEKLPASNLTFLIDVSGSMWEPNKLPLVKASLKLLVDQLRPQDKVAIVVYAGNAGLVLPSTSGDEKIKIKETIDQLEAGGSTAGGAGIQLAYKIAKQNFIKSGNNRVILCTDGDFNVGTSSDDELERLIEKERETGVFLTVLGFGTGNYQDAKMQKLADKGNGNHAYIDGINEAKKVMVNEFGGTLFTIAKDVKLQIEFNPVKIKGYRLIGYENRILAKEDFNNDKKDAGDLGSGHTVTALYEIIPANADAPELDSVDALKYRREIKNNIAKKYNDEIMNIKLRYKKPDGDISKLIESPLFDHSISFKETSDNFRFASAVAAYGMLLRDSKFKGNASYDMVKLIAGNSLGKDAEGYRKEFINMVENTKLLVGKTGKKQEENEDVSVK